jgi:hypothetical protein
MTSAGAAHVAGTPITGAMRAASTTTGTHAMQTSFRAPSRALNRTATALAVAALLAACGGGEVEPPPDTVPPTLAITDDVSAAVADGVVTFTFTFSEDVGDSFVAEDVLVTGGTAGTLTQVSTTVYTLAVTPPEDASGSISVSVAAAKFRDLSNNDNVAESTATQAFDTLVPPPTGSDTVVVSFDEATLPTLGAFGDAGPSIATPPAGGGSGAALKLDRSGGVNFGGTFFNVPAIPFAADRKTITAQVYATRANADIYLKVEVPGGAATEVKATTGAANTWQTLTWALDAVDPANAYTVMVFSADTDVAIGGAQTYWIDEVTLMAAASAGGGGGGSVACGTTEPTCAPTTAIPAGANVIYSDAASIAGLNMAPDWGQGGAVTRSEVTIAGNASQRYTFDGAPFLYQGIDWSGSPQNVTDKGTLHLDVWTADVESVKVSLIGGGGENPITRTLTPGSWNSLDIDLSEYTSPDLTQVIQIKLEPSAGGTIYVDNIYFHGTASSGGGGSTAFVNGIFAADYIGNLAAGTAQSTLGGSVGFFLDPRLFDNKAFEDGSVAGSAVNPGGVPNFYYGIGKLLPALTDAYFGGFVNAPGNTPADASAYGKIKLKFWGDAESWERDNFTANVDVIVQGPADAACANAAGRPEILKAVPAQKIGAGSEYIIAKTEFTLVESCGGAYTIDTVWSAVGAVVVRLAGTNLQYLNTTNSTPVSYPTFLNIGPISFIN